MKHIERDTPFLFLERKDIGLLIKKWINVQPTINACNLLLVHLFYMSQ
jgi:hypothetical protein